MSPIQQGVFSAIASNVLFSILYLFSYWMAPLTGTTVFAWRTISMLVGLWVILWMTGSWTALFQFIKRTRHDTKKWMIILCTTPILASQFWLFMWAPVNGYGVDVAIGYFLFPLMIILCGRVFLKEKLNHWQWIAVTLAALGVANEVWQTHTFSWVALWVFGTYPIYHLTRRHFGVPALIGLSIDLTLITPFVIIYLVFQPESWHLVTTTPKYWIAIPLLGIFSAAAMQLNLHANRMLPVTLFGMFSYLEPALLFILALVVFKTPLTSSSLVTYSFIWAGLLFALLDGYLKCRYPVQPSQQ